MRQAEPSGVLETLNEVLLRDRTDRFCTVAVVRLREAAAGWTARLACGGHPLPIAFDGGAARSVGTPGTLLGVFDSLTVGDTTVELGPGDGLVLYTDGITEARGREQMFGEARLVEAIGRHKDAADLSAAIVDEALAFQGGNPSDDIVVVTVRVPAARR